MAHTYTLYVVSQRLDRPVDERGLILIAGIDPSEVPWLTQTRLGQRPGVFPEAVGAQGRVALADERTVRGVALTTLIAACALAVAAGAANASFPGGSGRIVWTVPFLGSSPVGADASPLNWKAPPPRVDASRVSWSPDGRRLLIPPKDGCT